MRYEVNMPFDKNNIKTYSFMEISAKPGLYKCYAVNNNQVFWSVGFGTILIISDSLVVTAFKHCWEKFLFQEYPSKVNLTLDGTV